MYAEIANTSGASMDGVEVNGYARIATGAKIKGVKMKQQFSILQDIKTARNLFADAIESDVCEISQ